MLGREICDWEELGKRQGGVILWAEFARILAFAKPVEEMRILS